MTAAQLELWLRMFETLKDIPLCCSPRYMHWFSSDESDSVDYSLVCFCDASAKAYVTAIYLHQLLTSPCKIDQIFLKTRLAPQNMTIPRLKFLGVLVGVRALKFVLRELYLHVTSSITFTDSMCVVH